MLTGNFYVLDTSTVISQWPYDKDAFLYNTGEETIYLKSEESFTTDRGMPLKPRDTKRWEAGLPIFAICEPGKTGKLNVTENPGMLFSPSSIAEAIYISGTPPVDKYVSLHEETITIIGGGSFLLPNINVADFGSIVLKVYTTCAGVPIISDHLLMSLDWFDDGPLTYAERFVLTPTSFFNSKLETKGPQLEITIDNVCPVGGDTVTTITISGSYRTSNYWLMEHGLAAFNSPTTFEMGGASYRAQEISMSIPNVAATNYFYYPEEQIPGPVQINVRKSQVAATVVDSQFAVIDVVTGAILLYQVLPATGAGIYTYKNETYSPQRPIGFRIGQLGTIPFDLQIALLWAK